VSRDTGTPDTLAWPPGHAGTTGAVTQKKEKNMFDKVLEQILSIARDAWGFLAGLLIIVAMLGGLFYVLQGTAGAAFGGGRTTAMAITGLIGVVLLVIVAFLLIPQLGEMLKSLQPQPPF